MASRSRRLVTVVIVVTMMLRSVSGHGRMVEPPARSTMWRHGFNTTRNYNDNSLNCGGVNVQWYVNQGRCGVCGDPWSQPPPRDNEAGGPFGKGVIARTYTPGQVIQVWIDVTANQGGWFEFRLCPHNDPSTPVTQRCFDQNLLPMADGSGTRYTLGSQMNAVRVELQLPPSITCSQCVLQWKWRSANNYGRDPSTGQSCTGCGPAQEEFYGCSDVAITASGAATAAPTTEPRPPQSTAPVTPPPSLSITAAATPSAPPPGRQSYPPFKPITYVPVSYTPFKPPTPTPSRPDSTQQAGKTNPPFQPITYIPESYTPLRPATTPQTVTTYPPFRPITYLPASHTPYKPGTTPQAAQSYPPFKPITHLPASVSPYRPVSTPQTAKTYPPFRPITYVPASHTPYKPGTTPQAAQSYPPFKPITHLPASVSPYRPVSTPQTAKTYPPFRPITYIPASYTPLKPATRPVTATPQAAQTYPPFQPVTYIPMNTPDRPASTAPPLPTSAPPLPTTAPPPPTVASPSTARLSGRCYGINSWSGIAALDRWCDDYCPLGVCPQQNCACGLAPPSASPASSAAPPLSSGPASAASSPPPRLLRCRAVGLWSGQKLLDDWCGQTCAKYICDPQYCICDPLPVV